MNADCNIEVNIWAFLYCLTYEKQRNSSSPMLLQFSLRRRTVEKLLKMPSKLRFRLSLQSLNTSLYMTSSELV
jgi:hypothetical protein